MPGVEVPKAAPSLPAEKKDKERESVPETAPALQPISSFLKKHGATMGTVVLCAAIAGVLFQSPTGKQVLSAMGGFVQDLATLAGKIWHYIIPSSHA